MSATMAPPKRTKSQQQAATPDPKKPNREGKPIHVWVDDALLKALDKFRSSQRLQPTLKDTVELALQEFLIREGFWSPESEP